MQKVATLLFCFFIPLYLQAQSTTGIVPPQAPKTTSFQPVVINTATRTITALPKANAGTDIYLQDQQKLKQRQKELDLITQEVQKYKQKTQQPTKPQRNYDYTQYSNETKPGTLIG